MSRSSCFVLCSPEFLRLEQSRRTYLRDEGARPLWPLPASGDGVPLLTGTSKPSPLAVYKNGSQGETSEQRKNQ